MNGVTIFLLGMVAMSNVGLVLFLINDANKKRQSEPIEPTAPKQPNPEPPPKEVVEEPQKSLVGKSKTRIEDFDSRFKAMEEKVNRVVDLLDKIGDHVKLSDVEFANEEDKPSEEEIRQHEASATAPETSESPKSARMTKEQEDAAFEDARIEDFDGDNVAAPSANGSTIEDIEEAFDAATNPTATAEQKVKAGRVIFALKATNLYDAVSNQESIRKGLENCVATHIRESIAEKSKGETACEPKIATKPVTPSPTVKKPIAKPKKSFHISDNIDDFDPASLIR